VTDSTRLEESINPELADTAAKVKAGGIIVPHPSANYHLADGATVFFEVEEIHMSAALRTALEQRNTDAIRLLSMITAIVLRLWSDGDLAMLAKRGPEGYIRHSDYSDNFNASGSFARRSFGEITDAVLDVFLRGEHLTLLDCKLAVEMYGIWDYSDSGGGAGFVGPAGVNIDRILRGEY
jgi:hypothetical protein